MRFRREELQTLGLMVKFQVEKKEFRERKGKNGILKTVLISRLKQLRKDPTVYTAPRVNHLKFFESARADYPNRPSGWFQRRSFKNEKKSSLMPERILDPCPVGMVFRWISDSESSEI